MCLFYEQSKEYLFAQGNLVSSNGIATVVAVTGAIRRLAQVQQIYLAHKGIENIVLFTKFNACVTEHM